MTILTSSLTLIRPGPSGPQIFWARRRRDRTFLGGFHAFFAGSVEEEDARLPVDDQGSPDRKFKAAACRECFEECGLFIGTDGASLAQPAGPFAVSRLHEFGWWTTPPWLKPDFLTAFYGIFLTAEEGRALEDLEDHLDKEEFDGGAWITPVEALEKWRAAEAFITTPIRLIIESLTDLTESTANLPTPPELAKQDGAPTTSRDLQLFDGLTILPLKTPTLPPATHTNALVVGKKRFVVVDPGPKYLDDLRPLMDHLERRLDAGDQCTGLLLTHHHHDHMGGLQPVAELVDAPILAHEQTLERVDTADLQTHPVTGGDTLPTDSPADWIALHTPGHAPGHLALWNEDLSLLFAADLVAGQGTIIVDPPEGNMGHYLTSLERARDLSPRALLPSHGGLITAPTRLLDHYLTHRRAREQKVLAALRSHGPATAADLVPTVYDDAPRAVWPLAQRSLLAHLQHLVERDLARHTKNRFEPT